MAKIHLIVLLLLSSVQSLFAQRPDSVLLNGEWRYVYPAVEEISFESEYYNLLDVKYTHYDIWMEWRETNDPRVNLSKKQLRDSIQMELYRRLESQDSVYRKRYRRQSKFTGCGRYSRRNLHFGRYYGARISKRHIKQNPELAIRTPENPSNFVTPVGATLPNGKYVQFYRTYASPNKRFKSQLVDSVVACLFELKDNELDQHFIRFDVNGDTLVSGFYKNGFQEGLWMNLIENNRWFRHPRRPFSNEMISNRKVLKAEYSEGIKNGKSCYYRNDYLIEQRTFLNDVWVGNATFVYTRDSIVFDPMQVFDIDEYALDEIVNENRTIPSYAFDINKKLKKKVRSFCYDLNAFEFNYLDDEKNVQLRYNTDADRKYLDSLKNRTYHNTAETRDFQTFLRVYDRKTKQLRLERYVDTLNALYYGASYWPSGAKFDTVWVSANNLELNRIYFDEDGLRLPYVADKIEKVAPLKEPILINGIEVKLREVSFAPDYYESIDNIERGDTTFTELIWNTRKELLYQEYYLSNDKRMFEFFLPDKQHFSNLSNFDERWCSLKQDNFEIRLHFLKGKDSLRDLEILCNNQPFDGEVLLEKGSRFDIAQTNNGGLRIVLGEIESMDQKWMDHAKYYGFKFKDDIYFDEEFLSTVLGFNLPEIDAKRISGSLKNGRLVGDVGFECSKSDDFTLNYIDGLANGKVELKRKKYKSDYYDMMRSSISSKNPAKNQQSKYVTSHFSLKQGKLDGLRYELTDGDTSSFYSYSNGVLNGPFYQYSIQKKVNAYFKNGYLEGYFTIVNLPNYGGDTIINELFDNGELISGTYFEDGVFYKSNNVPLRIQVSRLTDKRYMYSTSLNNVLVETNTVDKNDLINSTSYLNGILHNSMDYSFSKSGMIFNLRSPFTKSAWVFYGTLKINGGEWYNQSFLGGTFLKESLTTYSSESESGDFKKYYSNGVVAREGFLKSSSKKLGVWTYRNYSGDLLCTIDYKDSLFNDNGSIWLSKGTQTIYDSGQKPICTRLVIEEIETYKCTSDEYYAERQFITIQTNKDSLYWNGWSKNYYDNGVLMSEGNLMNGKPDGLWKVYKPDGTLTKLGRYSNGIKHGKWLEGDLGKKAYIDDVCIDPDDEYFNYHIHQLELDKEITIYLFKNGKIINTKL